MVSIGDQVIIQEFLQGTEYVVDTVSLDGDHKLTDIWRCHKGAHNGAAFVYEYFDLLDSEGDIQQILFEYACSVLDGLEIKQGPGHSEIYIRENGQPVLVEIGSRLGGPRMPYGTSPCVASQKAQTEYTVDAYVQPELFHDKWKDSYKKTKHSRMVFLIHTQNKLFCGLNETIVNQIKGLTSFYHVEFAISEGDLLKKTIDVRSSPGFIYLIHNDKAQIEADYEQIRALEAHLYQTHPMMTALSESVVIP